MGSHAHVSSFQQQILTSTWTNQLNATYTVEITQTSTSVSQYYLTSIWTSTYTLPTVYPEGTGPYPLYSITPPVTTATGTAILAVMTSNGAVVTEVVQPPREKRVPRVRREAPRADED